MIRVGDIVYRMDFDGSDITTHPGVSGTVTKIRVSNSAGPDIAYVTFTLGELSWRRVGSVDKLTTDRDWRWAENNTNTGETN